MPPNEPEPTVDDILMAGAALVAEFERLRAESGWAGQDAERERPVLSLLSWDLSQFMAASLETAAAGRWSVAHSFPRLIQERAEYLIAAHADPKFAMQLWGALEALEHVEYDDGKIPRIREGIARGIVRKWSEGRTNDATGSRRFLENLIRMKDVGSLMVHPSLAAILMGHSAAADSLGADAHAIAGNLAHESYFAFMALVGVVSERNPDSRNAHTALAVAAEMKPLLDAVVRRPKEHD
jgi:hypothetical protein